MNLKQTKRPSDGRVWLSIVKKYRKDGISKTRTVEKLGWLDDLEKVYEDPVAHFRAYAKELTAAEQAESAAKTIIIHPLKKIDKRSTHRKNLGFAALSAVYHLLGIHTHLINRQRHRRFGYSVDAVMRLLVFDRILQPSSKKAAWESRDAYFERFDFSKDDVYRALTHIASLKSSLMAHLNTKVSSIYGRDMGFVYYDVTNYYFQSDETDKLRKRGVNKAHTPDPVVQMGLLMDKGGLPVAYDLFPGNTLDLETLPKVIDRIKGDTDDGGWGFGRIVVVADKGINTSDNIATLLAEGDGYVFSRSVRGGTDELKEWVTDQTGYKTSSTEDGTFMVKSRIAERVINVTTRKADLQKGVRRKTKQVKVTEKQVAFWSEKYARRARHDRAEAVTKALKMVEEPSRLKGMLEHTAAKYVIGLKVDDNGEIVELKDALYFNDRKLSAEEELDGYYVISSSEVELSDGEIIDIYRGLWRIEETFRVTKSDMRQRPVYVWTADHIEAHFLICFVALLIIRIIQVHTGWRYSAKAIASTLAKASGTHEGDNWWLFDHRDDAIDDIGDALGIDFTRERMTTAQIRSLVGKPKKPDQKT